MIWNGEKCDRKCFSVIQNGPNRTSKMAAAGHFEKKITKKKFSVIQNGRCSHFVKKNYVAYWSEMARNAISHFAGSHFVNKMKKKKLRKWLRFAPFLCLSWEILGLGNTPLYSLFYNNLLFKNGQNWFGLYTPH